MKSKSGIEVAGLTTNGGVAYCGIFKMQDTFGIPLILIWKQLADRGAVIAWDVYITDALAHGWSRDKISSGIREIAQFGYERTEGQKFMTLINQMMEEMFYGE